ncbi:hypothetical protein, partial [Comamonas testosteroni]|uniref:hypothetical protein n=1 Tax=Comamonas testosteroni TaxID=285 RepID=UPI001C105A08
DEVFGPLVVGQQARQQFFGYVVFLGVHSVYGQAGLRRLLIGRLHKILHTLRFLAAVWLMSRAYKLFSERLCNNAVGRHTCHFQG